MFFFFKQEISELNVRHPKNLYKHSETYEMNEGMYILSAMFFIKLMNQSQFLFFSKLYCLISVNKLSFIKHKVN